MKLTKKQRTTQQNRALYLYFNLVSEEAKNTGVTFTEFIRKRPQLDMMWTPERVKEIWKTAQYHLFNQTSTTELSSTQIDQVYDVVNKVLGEIMGIYIPFPSIETLIEYDKKTND
jgi:hypothetical protein